MTTVKWYGEEVKKEIHNAIPGGLHEAAQQFLDSAKSKAPQGATGDLRESAYYSGEGKSTYRAAKNYNKEVKPKEGVAAGFAAFYARFHELGTKNMSARPFVRPTIDEQQGKLGNVIVEAMRKKLK